MKLVNLLPLGEININDPALVKARAAKNQMDKIKPNPRIGFDQALDLRDEKKDLELRISNLYREMESDPDVEAEGGPVADQYGDELNKLETRLYKINKEIASYDMSEGTTLNETTEKAWNAIDVSRKAEKEISNREWNERTTKKLDMLKALNAAGKFKKDFDEERLQGWVDQNYSWEKLSRQFKLNESKNNKMKGKLLTERFQELAGIKPLYEADPEAIKGKHYPDEETVKKLRKGPYASGGQNAHLEEMIKKVVNLKMDSDVGEPVTVEYDPTKNLQDVTISWGNESHTVDFEAGDEIDNHGNEGSDIETIANSDDGRWQFILDVYVGYQFDMTGDYEEWDFDELIIQHHPENEDHLDPEDRFDQDPMEEGSCGYGPDGVPGDTPGETKGMPADTRTMTMMRESIRKEIKRLHENK